MEAHVGEAWPQARDHLGPLETGRGRDRFCSRASREGTALPTVLILAVRAPGSEGTNFCCFQLPGV